MTGACDACLRRTLLLGRLAGHIERSATGRPGSQARELLALSDESLARAVAGSRAEQLLAAAADEPASLRQRLSSLGCWSLCCHGRGYPRQLRRLGRAAPAALLGRGSTELLSALGAEPAVTIVGSRRASTYGADVAHELARMLTLAGVAVVSGLALGIDSAAHRGALAGDGRTVAVLGNGPDRAYPPSNRSLHGRIVDGGGVAISELPPRTGAFRWTFPARNRMMAAIAGITVVVEAAARSGSLITAEMAQEAGREVGAVPGRVNSWLSEGTNALLHDGAHVIRDAGDVLDLLLGAGMRTTSPRGPALDERLRAVLSEVEAGRSSADEVALGAGADANAAAAALARLELLGYLRSDVTGVWSRTQLVPPDPHEPRP